MHQWVMRINLRGRQSNKDRDMNRRIWHETGAAGCKLFIKTDGSTSRYVFSLQKLQNNGITQRCLLHNCWVHVESANPMLSFHCWTRKKTNKHPITHSGGRFKMIGYRTTNKITCQTSWQHVVGGLEVCVGCPQRHRLRPKCDTESWLALITGCMTRCFSSCSARDYLWQESKSVSWSRHNVLWRRRDKRVTRRGWGWGSVLLK